MIFALEDRIPQVADGVYVAPNAMVIGDVRLAAGSSVWFGAVLRGDVECLDIGCDTNIQDNAVLHSDPGAPLLVSARVTVGHLAMLHGCTIGEGSLIGIGAIVMNRARIGARSIVGAGALVTEGREFPPEMLIMGSPAKPVRPLSAEEIARLDASAQHYAKRAQLYGRVLRPV
jgi:carbonic anhydrase/acetyltransferase-like protein (isoleucine patch superfamily)